MRYFVKLDKRHHPVPGSLVYNTTQPKKGKWHEIHKICPDEEGYCIQPPKPDGYFQKLKFFYLTDCDCQPIPGSNISAYCKPTTGNYIEYYPTCLIKPCPEFETVTICGVTWMLRNLDVTHYADGTPIPETEGFYYNNDSSIGSVYGRMYTPVAINSSHALAPDGWKLANKEDWDNLMACLGDEPGAGFGTIGDKLKITGTHYWNSPNLATNSSGLSIKGGGVYDDIDGFFGLKYIVSMAYNFNPLEATMERLLFNDSSAFDVSIGGEFEACYVRCIKL